MDLFESATSTGDLLQDFFDAGGPDKGRRVGVPRGEEGCDGLLQILDATKDAPAHGLLAEFGKPAFDQVEPTGTGGNKVQDKARMFGQPASGPFMAVGAVVTPTSSWNHRAQRSARFHAWRPSRSSKVRPRWG